VVIGGRINGPAVQCFLYRCQHIPKDGLWRDNTIIIHNEENFPKIINQVNNNIIIAQ
jgi:hypothetical protein